MLSLYGSVFDLNEEVEPYPLTIGGIRRYVRDEYGVEVSKSSVCAVRDKCGASEIGLGTAKVVPELRSRKELVVYEAFKALGVV